MVVFRKIWRALFSSFALLPYYRRIDFFFGLSVPSQLYGNDLKQSGIR